MLRFLQLFPTGSIAVAFRMVICTFCQIIVLSLSAAEIQTQKNQLHPHKEQHRTERIGWLRAGAPVAKAVTRVTFWGALAMAATAGIGRLFGVAV